MSRHLGKALAVLLGAAAALLVGLGTAAPADAGPETATAPPTTGAPTSAPTSTERTRNGCPALQVDPRLTTAAQGHAADMAADNYFSHTSLDGRTFDQRIRAAGHPSPGGENIAKGQTSPSAVVTAWMNSPGHRTNILNCSFRTIGVGFDARGNHWVQNFGY